MTELLKPQLSNIFCFLVTPQKSQLVFFFYKEHKHESRLYLCKIYRAYCAVYGKLVCTRGAYVILISERTGVFSKFSCCSIWWMKSYVCSTFTGGSHKGEMVSMWNQPLLHFRDKVAKAMMKGLLFTARPSISYCAGGSWVTEHILIETACTSWSWTLRCLLLTSHLRLSNVTHSRTSKAG